MVVWRIEKQLVLPFLPDYSCVGDEPSQSAQPKLLVASQAFVIAWDTVFVLNTF